MTGLKLGLTLVLSIILLLPSWTAAQQADRKLVDGMLDCAMHEGPASWVPKELRSDGQLRFNYVYEGPRAKPGPYDYPDKFYRLYVAFWSADRAKGEFLDFTPEILKGKRRLTISNQGHIFYSGSKLNLDFFQGGVWMEKHYMIRLRRLAFAPVQTIAVGNIRHTGTLCDSFLNP